MSRSASCPLPQSYRMGLVSCTSPLHLRTRGARIGSAPIGVDKGPVGVDCAPRRPVAQRGRLISAAGEGDPTSILRGVAGAPSEGQMITAHATRRCGNMLRCASVVELVGEDRSWARSRRRSRCCARRDRCLYDRDVGATARNPRREIRPGAYGDPRDDAHARATASTAGVRVNAQAGTMVDAMVRPAAAPTIAR
jgi:hypothetical protein